MSNAKVRLPENYGYYKCASCKISFCKKNKNKDVMLHLWTSNFDVKLCKACVGKFATQLGITEDDYKVIIRKEMLDKLKGNKQ